MADDLNEQKKKLIEWLEGVDNPKILNDVLVVMEESAVYTSQLSKPEVPLSPEEISAIKKGFNSPHPTVTREEAKKAYAKYI